MPVEPGDRDGLIRHSRIVAVGAGGRLAIDIAAVVSESYSRRSN
jgi:hypothetical protein